MTKKSPRQKSVLIRETKTSRHLGVDLHRNSFLVCVREQGQGRFQRWSLEQLPEFVAGLRPEDELAVEATGNTRWFCRAVAEHVRRIVVVNPHQFRVISQSVKKTDRRDAALLAEYLEKDLLPEVRRKSDEQSEVAQVAQARDQLVKMRTMLKNQLHGLFSSYGVLLQKKQLASRAQRAGLGKIPLPPLADVQRRVLLGQIEALEASTAELERAITAAAQALPGHQNLVSVKGIGSLSAAILLSAIGPVEDFPDPAHLAAYFGMVPRVNNSNETERHGRITRRGNKLARTTLVQCALVAKRYSPFLQRFYERIQRRRGTGKAIVATARKLLTIVYYTLKNHWVFTDFAAFAVEG
jgi:transposase